MTDISSVKPYVIVVFPKENGVSLIPSGWVVSAKEALWPPFKNPGAIVKAIQMSIPPDVRLWTRCPMRVLCACGMYGLLG